MRFVSRGLVAALASVGLLASASVAEAASFSFNYTALSSSQFQAASGDFGSELHVGDDVTFTLTTPAGQKFLADLGGSMWAILGVDSTTGGNVNSSYSYSFFNNGALVSSGAHDQNTGSIHIGPDVSFDFAGFFDTYVWNATILGSSHPQMFAADIGYGAGPLALYGGTWTYGQTSAFLQEVGPTPTPLPAAVWLFGSALMGLFGTLRLRRASAA